VKQTVNVLRLPILILLLFFLSGCGFSFFKKVKPVEVISKPIERTKLNLKEPAPLKSPDIKWVVVTKDNFDKVFEKLEKNNQELVLFGLTAKGYEKLAISMAEVRNFINSQRIIILKYKEYYETDNSSNK